MSSYDTYLKSAQTSAKKQQKEYETKRNQQLQKTLDSLAAATATQQRALQTDFAQQSDATRHSYEGLFDRNAIYEAVSRKAVAERMANLGLTDSGLNRTQQTAIATTRSKADAQTALQQQSALDLLASQLQTALAESNYALQKDKNTAINAAQSDIQDNLNRLLALATEQAGSRYETEVQAKTEKEKARIAAEQAAKKAAKEAEVALEKARIAAEQADRQAAKEAQTAIQKAEIDAQAKRDTAKLTAEDKTISYVKTYLELLQESRAYASTDLALPYQAVVKLLRQKLFGF